MDSSNYIPKGTSPKVKGTKRLAIAVEDHPLDYADFEGVIPEGHYGAGIVMLWDKGTFENITKIKEKEVPMKNAYESGRIIIRLSGKKLKGGYALIKTKRMKQWLPSGTG